MLALVLFFAMQTQSAPANRDDCAGFDQGQGAVCVQAPETKLKTPAGKPTVTLTVSPRMAIWSEGHPTEFRLRLAITDADEQLWCPEVQWQFPDDTRTTEEGDCVPYDQASPKDMTNQTWTKIVVPGPGRWTIGVNIRKAGKTIAHKDVTFTVVAPRDPE